MGVVAPNAGAPAVTRAARPVFHPPVLVSDSPFNSYADGYFSLPRPHGSGTRGQVMFGIGAGRFTQSTNQGNNWVALPKWNREAADLNGYTTPRFRSLVLPLGLSHRLEHCVTVVT